jgi:tetratricopeptide (TPR) repeat protein
MDMYLHHGGAKRWTIAALAIVLSGVAFAGWYRWDGAGAAMSLERLRLASAANDWSAVRSGGQRYLRRHPEDAEAIVLVARAEAAAQRSDRALKLLATVATNSPWSPEARLREGQAWRQSFRGAAAERSFRQAIDQGLATSAPQRLIDAARLGLVQLYAIEARNDEARPLIWELHRVSPQPVAVLELLGRLDVEGAEPHEASQELERFIAADPGDFDACRGLAQHYLVLGRAREARPLAERCLEARCESLAAWETLLSCLNDLGDNDSLAEALDRVPEAASEMAWYWKFRGIVAENMEQWEAAEAAFRQALRHDPFDSRTHYRLGRLLVQLGKDVAGGDEHMAEARRLTAAHTQLRELYRRVLLNNQQGIALSAALCAGMGEQYETLGLRDGAAGWYRESLKRDPTGIKSREGLARLDAISAGVSAP